MPRNRKGVAPKSDKHLLRLANEDTKSDIKKIKFSHASSNADNLTEKFDDANTKLETVEASTSTGILLEDEQNSEFLDDIAKEKYTSEESTIDFDNFSFQMNVQDDVIPEKIHCGNVDDANDSDSD